MIARLRRLVSGHRVLTALTVAVVGSMPLVADSCSSNGSSDNQAAVGNSITEQYQGEANKTVPYPLSQMDSGGWLERTLLRENLLRQNNPHRLAYVILLNQLGQPIVQYPIQGMVFELNSQLTPTQALVDNHGRAVTPDNNCGGQGKPDLCSVVDSPGDNGTYGPEPQGIGFFTTSGVEVKWNGLYIESDSPLNLTTKPLITYDVNSQPSVNAGGVHALPTP